MPGVRNTGSRSRSPPKGWQRWPAPHERRTPYPAPSPRRTGTKMPISKRPAPDRPRHESSILRLEIGSCERFSSADAGLTDHSFATGDLIEVKVQSVLRSPEIFSNRTGQSAGKPALPWHVPAEASSLFKRSFTTPAGSTRPVRSPPRGSALRFGGTPEPGGDRPHPAADGGSQSFRIGGHDRQNETSRDHAQPKRRQAPDVLT